MAPRANASALMRGLLLRRQDDHRDVPGRGVGPEELDQRQPVDLGHDEVLEDDGGRDLLGHLERLGRVAAVVEADVGLAGKHPAHGLADDRLVVDQ